MLTTQPSKKPVIPTIILDKARFHRSEESQKRRVVSTGCRLFFAPVFLGFESNREMLGELNKKLCHVLPKFEKFTNAVDAEIVAI